MLVFGAFANAAGMVGPVVEWQDQLRMALGDPPPLWSPRYITSLAIVVLPLAAVGCAAALSRTGAAAE